MNILWRKTYVEHIPRNDSVFCRISPLSDCRKQSLVGIMFLILALNIYHIQLHIPPT
jgi:hypothetical protein